MFIDKQDKKEHKEENIKEENQEQKKIETITQKDNIIWKKNIAEIRYNGLNSYEAAYSIRLPIEINKTLKFKTISLHNIRTLEYSNFQPYTTLKNYNLSSLYNTYYEDTNHRTTTRFSYGSINLPVTVIWMSKIASEEYITKLKTKIEESLLENFSNTS